MIFDLRATARQNPFVLKPFKNLNKNSKLEFFRIKIRIRIDFRSPSDSEADALVLKYLENLIERINRF